jgi:hypothetical protein
MKPTVKVTGNSFWDFLENIDKGGNAHARTISSSTGFEKFEKPRTGRYGARASASVAQAAASYNVFGASAKALSADAHYQYGVHNSVGASATVARAEANVGPLQAGVGLNFDTGASVGIDGVKLDVLGFGFSFGPKMSIKTPIADISCSIM